MRAHRHAHILPNPEELGPEIEESAIIQHPLQALFLLPWGGAGPATALSPSSYILLLRWKGGKLTPISKNSRRRDRPPDQEFWKWRGESKRRSLSLSFLPSGRRILPELPARGAIDKGDIKYCAYLEDACHLRLNIRTTGLAGTHWRTREQSWSYLHRSPPPDLCWSQRNIPGATDWVTDKRGHWRRRHQISRIPQRCL